MSSEIVKTGSQSIKVDYQDGLSSAAIQQLKPQLAQKLDELGQRAEIVRVTVKIIDQTTTEVKYILEKGQCYRREVLPIVARADAFQSGLNRVRNMKLDNDLLEAAEKELKRKHKG